MTTATIGDTAMAALCDAALAGDVEACEEAIANAIAQGDLK
jgi:hypothetical protein